MYRQTPLSAGFVGYTGGGARALVDTVNDDTMMQEMKGSFMQGEAREKVESPQNYGFTSVVRPATKGKDGQIEKCAEAFMSFLGGNRSHAVCTMMDDRRYRPMGLKPGENAQYDDLGQMTLMRRNGLYLLTNNNAEDQQQQQSGDGATATPHADSSQQQVERFVSVRHVEKKKQERKSQQQGGSSQGGGGGASAGTLATSGSSGSSGQSKQDFKHEGETVNTEIRVTKGRIEFRSGDKVVGYYDKGSSTWVFIGKVKLGTEDASHPVYGVNGGKGMTTATSGSGSVLVNATQPGPPTSLDMEP
jgi:phage gp45-like